MNGLISFGEDYANYNPTRLPDGTRKLLCPYWTDLDLSSANTDSHVWYKVPTTVTLSYFLNLMMSLAGASFCGLRSHAAATQGSA